MILTDMAYRLSRRRKPLTVGSGDYFMALQKKAWRYLGRILVDGGFLSLSDLERALEEQRNTNELLGQVLVRMGVLDPVDLNAALSVQDRLVSLEDAVRTAAGVRLMLGELLLQAGHISEAQLEQALAAQKKSGEKLGEVFVRLGYLTEKQLNALLDFQQAQGSGLVGASPLKLGDIMVSAGHITREQLDDALRKQALSRKRLGEVLIEEGYARPREVRHGVRLQQKLIASVLAAILAFAALPEAEAEAARASRAELRVSATVLPFTTLNVQNRSATITVTEADVSRGYVDVAEGSSIEVRSNSRDGYYLSFECFDSSFRQVRINGLGRPAVVGSGSGIVPMAMDARVARIELSYRFILAEGVKPGEYPWPLTVSVVPM